MCCLQVFPETAQHDLRLHPVPGVPVLHVRFPCAPYLPQVGDLRLQHVAESTQPAHWLVLILWPAHWLVLLLWPAPLVSLASLS